MNEIARLTNSKGGWLRIFRQITIDPASIGANADANVDVTITGVNTTNSVIVFATTSGLNAGLELKEAFVQADNTVRLVVRNNTGSGIDDTAFTAVIGVLDGLQA